MELLVCVSWPPPEPKLTAGQHICPNQTAYSLTSDDSSTSAWVECSDGDSCAPVGSVSLSGAFLLGLVSRRCVDLSDVLSVYLCEIQPDDLYSESVCERWDALLMEEASVWCVNGCSSTTHTFMSQGLIWLTDLHSFWSFCYMKVTLKLCRKLLTIPSSLNDATFQMPLRKFSYQC